MSAIVLGNLVVDPDRYAVWVNDSEIPLTFLEFELLFALAEHPDHLVTRAELVARAWRGHRVTGERPLNIQITRLRKKLVGTHPWALTTVRKRGYLLRNRESARPDGGPMADS